MRSKQNSPHVLWLIVAVLMAVCSYPVISAAGTPRTLDLTEITLVAPPSPEARQYLGLKEKRNFPLSEIKTKFIVLGYYGIKCPYCHEQAPISNRVYEMIRSDPELEKDVRMIGVIIGSNPKNTATYANKYRIQYPMTNDPFFDIYRKLNKPKVPLTLLLTNEGKILVSITGAMSNPEGFVKKIKKFQSGH
ncbi:MAG: TlpA disulfide reductase family protein [Desulfoferrobacter sp.]